MVLNSVLVIPDYTYTTIHFPEIGGLGKVSIRLYSFICKKFKILNFVAFYFIFKMFSRD